MTKHQAKVSCYTELRRVFSRNGAVTGMELHHIFGRQGLLMVDPFGMIALPREEHERAHQLGMQAWADSQGHVQKHHHIDIDITPKDYLRLASAYRKCNRISEVERVFTVWLEDIRSNKPHREFAEML